MTTTKPIISTVPQAPPATATVVCIGDSITKAQRPGVTAQETYSYLLERELAAGGLAGAVHNAGVGGQTSSDGLARFHGDVLAKRPSAVVIMFGVTDSWIYPGATSSKVALDQYESNLRQMIALARKRGIAVVLATEPPSIAPNYTVDRAVTMKPYWLTVRRLAAELKLPLVDVYQRWAELHLEGVDLNTLMTDGQHPNPAGQAQIAALILPVLQNVLRQKQNRRKKPAAQVIGE